MSGRSEGIEKWAEAELRRIRGLADEEKLAAMTAVADRYWAEGDGDERITWLRRAMQEASDQGKLDWEMRIFGTLREMYAADGKRAYVRTHLMWYFKWLLERLPEYADFSAAEIEATFAGMEAMYREAGESLKPLYQLRARACVTTGRKDDVDGWEKMWREAPEGDSDDCAACQADFEIICALERDDVAAALVTFQRMCEERMWCDETPLTLSRLLLPAMMSKRGALTDFLVRASQQQVRRRAGMLNGLASHVVFRAMTGDPARATRLSGIALRRAAETRNDLYRCAAFRSVGFAFAVMVVAGQAPRLPRKLFSPGATGWMEAPEVASTCFAAGREVAERLDRRNGNGKYGEKLKATEEMLAKMVTAMSNAKEGPRRG